jgi:serine-type D-Ala-D-Ala endopeptidase (penicillin-binding protein 7)
VRRRLVLLLSLCLSIGIGGVSRAATPPTAPFMLVRDTDTGDVLFEHRSDHPRPIASITKLMTAMVALDQEPDLDRAVTLGPIHMLHPFGWKTPWEEGRTVRVGDMLRFALVASDNIAATTLVEECGLPLAVFHEQMNDKAEALGMVESQFGNVTGLDDRNSSTAVDVAVMAEAALAYPGIIEVCGMREAVAEPVVEGDEAIRSGATDRILWDPFWTVLVAKTGYTRLSGYCLVVVADAATGQRLTMVFLGTDRDGKRFRQVNRVKDHLKEAAAAALAPEEAR